VDALSFRLDLDSYGSGCQTELVRGLSEQYSYDGRDYSPYGEAWMENWHDEDAEASFGKEGFGFSTAYEDETGLVYFGFRYYSAEQGRFISRDPAGEGGSGVNLYAFAANDPVNYRDLYGLWAVAGEGSRPVISGGVNLGSFGSGSWNNLGSDGGYDRSSGFEGVPVLPPFIVKYSCDDSFVQISDGVYQVVNDCDGPKQLYFVREDLPNRGQNGSGAGPQGGPGGGGSSGGNGNPDPDDDGDQEENEQDWKPNKEDCDALASQYSKIYNAKPGDLLTENSAHLAGLLNAAAESINDPNREWGGFVRESDGGYTFTEPSRGSSDSWGNLFSVAWNKLFRSAVGAYHTHGYPSGWNIFSDQDARSSAFYNLDVSLVAPRSYGPGDTPEGHSPRLLEHEAAAELTWPEGFPNSWGGEPVPGSPVSQDFDRLSQCKAAGF